MISTMAQFSQRLLNKSAVVPLGMMVLAACLMVTGCSKTDPEPLQPDLAEEALQDTQNQNDTAVSATQVSTGASSGSAAESQPVNYNVQSWDMGEVEPISVDDIDDMKRIFGDVVLTDENSLDYASNIATKYRFMKGEDPYLDVIDSREYLEYGWYYANPNDSDKEKNISIDHAKKAYEAAQALMGDAGGEVVKQMLNGQIVKDKQVGAQQVALAKCEFYSCMLIVKKPT